MTASNGRLLELLADRASVGLGAREQIELAELLVHAQDVDAGAFDHAASAIALASLGKLEKMPAGLADRLEQAALASVDSRPASDFMSTRALDKLAPPVTATQVDPLATPISIDTSEPEPSDFKKTQAMDDRPASAPVRALTVTASPESIPTLIRPGDPPPRVIAAIAPIAPSGTSPVPFRAAPAPRLASSAPPQVAYPLASGAPFGSTSTSPPSNVVPLSAVRPAARAPSRAVATGGWIAAASCLLLAIGAFALRPPTAPVVTLPAPNSSPTSVPSAAPTAPGPAALASLAPAELRERLLAAEGSARAEWTPTKDPLGKAATGEVVWNKAQQKGTMRFKGLAKNDPTRAQYQLWIFDKTRDEKYPVDGGVFDVDSETGDVIVPIRATLAVNAPVLFAVTLEKPGGVVVSKRERIVVTAKMPAG